ncbi:hypothetical protein E4K67_08030 [Desulfosporosinus fructosivorans]|uniref:Uncharacterized protein n=1 Tax=Desulfosporosinus fructosivorans TaxID=2018669 RepID=A0A4Z0RAR7_9FIRM|nr:hypothetical protein [Desulfosporosinus fructosivorans]TGE39369.1 hypothetical protein E4K67_08030 [Desulfosporosinus fructosivorans]
MTFTSLSVANKNNKFHIKTKELDVNFTTGLFKNTPVEGVRPTASMAVLIDNNDIVEVTVQIAGYYLNGTTNVLYVLELLSLNPGEVATRNYYAHFNAFKFQFKTSSQAVEISVWGEDSAGNLVAAHRVLPSELALIPHLQVCQGQQS